MDYYVYVYLDKSKPGQFYYSGLDLCFLFEPFYIGKGTRYRDTRHLLFCNNHKSGTNPFYDKLKNKNTQPAIERIVTNISDDEAKEFEIFAINKIGRKLLGMGPLMNMTDGGTGGDTFSLLSEEKKKERLQKCSESMMGKNKGKKCSEEQKEKIRKSLTGRKNPDHSKWLKGKSQSESTKNKRSDSLKNHYKNNKSKKQKRIIQLDLEDNFIQSWDSISDAANFYNITKGSISLVCNNKRKTTNGYKWKFE